MAKEKVYDGEVLFRAWCQWGAAASNPRLMEFAKAEFGQTSQMGPHYAMWHWAFRHPEEAFELYKNWWFDNYPDREQIAFHEFLKTLQDKGRHQNIGGARRNLERFCAKYNLDMDFKVKEGDAVQVVRPNHPLFQSLLIVDRVDGDRVDAHYFVPDRSSYETINRNVISCQVNVKEIGVIGRVIV